MSPKPQKATPPPLAATSAKIERAAPPPVHEEDPGPLPRTQAASSDTKNRFSVWIDPRMKKVVDSCAAALGMSPSNLISLALVREIANNDHLKALPAIGKVMTLLKEIKDETEGSDG